MALREELPLEVPCRICGGQPQHLGLVPGTYSGRAYELRRCGQCRYAFIADPWTDFSEIYDARYYSGKGADPLVDYGFELEHPEQTIRRYEWRGITQLVKIELGALDGVNWLDFGCGNGGLVRYLRDETRASACGFEEGAIADEARRRGIRIIDRQSLEQRRGSFDVVTAIEVLEHTLDPLTELRAIRALLRPGGLLFLTTGNAAPFADRLLSWPYVIPEIHVSFFEPLTLEHALRAAAFRTGRVPFRGGFEQILKFKVLKNLGLRQRSRLTDLLPSRPLALLADRRVRLSDHPLGWAA